MNILEFDELSGRADDERAVAVRKHLVSNGWVYTSRHPGHHWMWSYTTTVLGAVDKHTYVVDESTALQFQRYWELEVQNFNAHDADCAIFKTFNWDDCNCIACTGLIEDDIAALDGDGESNVDIE